MKTNYKKQGKKNRASGGRFERKVRADLESKGWIISKWQNNVEIELALQRNFDVIIQKAKLIPAKRRYNPLKKVLTIGTGFPDFIAYKIRFNYDRYNSDTPYTIYGVEVKSDGYLTPEERAKCEWLINNKIFSKILIAKKGKKRGEIEYKEYGK